MKNDDFNELMEQARLRSLSPEEEGRLQEFLEADPGVWPDRNADIALNGLLGTMPDAPLASNFSSRVMQAIELEEKRVQRVNRPLSPHWWTHSWWARLGIVSCLATLAVVGWQQNQKRARVELAESVATISEVAAIPSVEILIDFEVIQSLGAAPPEAEMEADLNLLAALE